MKSDEPFFSPRNLKCSLWRLAIEPAKVAATAAPMELIAAFAALGELLWLPTVARFVDLSPALWSAHFWFVFTALVSFWLVPCAAEQAHRKTPLSSKFSAETIGAKSAQGQPKRRKDEPQRTKRAPEGPRHVKLNESDER